MYEQGRRHAPAQNIQELEKLAFCFFLSLEGRPPQVHETQGSVCAVLQDLGVHELHVLIADSVQLEVFGVFALEFWQGANDSVRDDGQAEHLGRDPELFKLIPEFRLKGLKEESGVCCQI